MRSRSASSYRFKILPKGNLFITLLLSKSRELEKKLPYAISFPSLNVAMATRHPCLAPPLFQLPMLRLLSLTPKTAFLKHFQLLYAVEFLLYLGLILSDVVYNSEFLGFRGK